MQPIKFEIFGYANFITEYKLVYVLRCRSTNTKWLKNGKLRKAIYIIRILQDFATKLWNITNFVMLFQAVMKFLPRSKF
jgi:hypothetical protein